MDQISELTKKFISLEKKNLLIIHQCDCQDIPAAIGLAKKLSFFESNFLAIFSDFLSLVGAIDFNKKHCKWEIRLFDHLISSVTATNWVKRGGGVNIVENYYFGIIEEKYSQNEFQCKNMNKVSSLTTKQTSCQ